MNNNTYSIDERTYTHDTCIVYDDTIVSTIDMYP